MRRLAASVVTILAFTLGVVGEQAPPADANTPEITSQETPVTFSSRVNLMCRLLKQRGLQAKRHIILSRARVVSPSIMPPAQ
jgi:hypothetical protein